MKHYSQACWTRVVDRKMGFYASTKTYENVLRELERVLFVKGFAGMKARIAQVSGLHIQRSRRDAATMLSHGFSHVLRPFLNEGPEAALEKFKAVWSDAKAPLVEEKYVLSAFVYLDAMQLSPVETQGFCKLLEWLEHRGSYHLCNTYVWHNLNEGHSVVFVDRKVTGTTLG